MIKYPLVSIYTCVYNGSKTIDRVFSSVKALKYPNIEHIIINDGSIDDTEDKVLAYKKNAKYPVIYLKKDNGGKHTALNKAWSIANGYFMIQLDADDELLPHSINYLVDAYFTIPNDIRKDYWCVHGRFIDQHGVFIGDKYPPKINCYNWKIAKETAKKYKGDKIGLQVSDYLKNYRFPEVKGVSHIPESIIWSQINNIYGTWYTNEIVGVYWKGEGDNLTAKKTKREQFGPICYWYKWNLINNNNLVKSILFYSLCYHLSSKRFKKSNPYLDKESKYLCLLLLLYPFTLLAAFFYRLIKRIT